MTKQEILKAMEGLPDNAELVIAEWQSDDRYHYKAFRHPSRETLRKAPKTMDVELLDGTTDRRPVFVLGNRDNCPADSADEFFAGE